MNLRTLVSEERTVGQITIAMNMGDSRMRKKLVELTSAVWNPRHKSWVQPMQKKIDHRLRKNEKCKKARLEKRKVGEINL